MGSGTSNSGAEQPGRPHGIRALIETVVPRARFGDQLAILSGTGQNVAGLALYVVATFAINILISRSFGSRGPSALGIVTLATQFAFVGAAATRFGMDAAALRRVAIDVGKGEPGRVRGVLGRAAWIAALWSVGAAALAFAVAGPVSRVLGLSSPSPLRAAALALPFVALCQVYLGGTRGLKIMRYTLYIYWAGQPVAWIVFMLAGWTVSRSATTAVTAYGASWVAATAAAWLVWRRETARFDRLPAPPGEVRQLLRYGAPRAPAALLSQLIYWSDYFIVSHYVGSSELGVYAAAVRVAQALVLLLVAVNYMFSPFVADLHARGERDRLNELYQLLTRWMVAGTIPLLLLLAVAPGAALHAFGAQFGSGSVALRILLIGQFVNVATGSVGFILIMVGRTGWDLTVYVLSFVLDAGLALALAPHLGSRGGAVAQMVALVVSNGLGLYLVWRFVRIQPFNRQYLRLALPTVIGAAVMVGAHLLLRGSGWPADLVGTGLIGGAAYTTLLLTTGLTPGERRTIAAVVSRRRIQGS